MNKISTIETSKLREEIDRLEEAVREFKKSLNEEGIATAESGSLHYRICDDFSVDASCAIRRRSFENI